MLVACRLTSISIGFLNELRFCGFLVTAAASSRRYLGVLDPDGLRVYKGVRTEVRKLATVAAVFDAAYRNARVRSSDAIDENTAGVEIARHFASQLDVSGPEIAAQTKLACIGRTNGRINVWNAG